MDISKNFSFEELTITNSGLPNKPGKVQIAKLTDLVNNVLQPIRDRLGKPIKVNSGFRSLAVNKAVGGVATSQHCNGEAAGLEAEDNAKLFKMIRQYAQFDQLIWEGGNDSQPDWVNVSYNVNSNKKEVLKTRVVDGVKNYDRI
jgi:zinc D-Ala-D-Ala carboxypeptidase